MTPSPIRKVLSSMRAHRVRALLMGGQACVFYGAAEFSRDTDFAILADAPPASRGALVPEPGTAHAGTDPVLVSGTAHTATACRTGRIASRALPPAELEASVAPPRRCRPVARTGARACRGGSSGARTRPGLLGSAAAGTGNTATRPRRMTGRRALRQDPVREPEPWPARQRGPRGEPLPGGVKPRNPLRPDAHRPGTHRRTHPDHPRSKARALRRPHPLDLSAALTG